MSRKVLLIVVPLLLLTMVVAQFASARMFRNTFHPEGDPIGNISLGGRIVDVIAVIECTAGERITVEVILSQGSEDFDDLENAAEPPNALGRGRANSVCEGEGNEQFIPVRVIAQGRETFVPGPATASGVAVTSDRGQKTDVRQWQPGDGITLE
jgi:hypothetical protein